MTKSIFESVHFLILFAITNRYIGLIEYDFGVVIFLYQVWLLIFLFLGYGVFHMFKDIRIGKDIPTKKRIDHLKTYTTLIYGWDRTGIDSLFLLIRSIWIMVLIVLSFVSTNFILSMQFILHLLISFSLVDQMKWFVDQIRNYKGIK